MRCMDLEGAAGVGREFAAMLGRGWRAEACRDGEHSKGAVAMRKGAVVAVCDITWAPFICLGIDGGARAAVELPNIGALRLGRLMAEIAEAFALAAERKDEGVEGSS